MTDKVKIRKLSRFADFEKLIPIQQAVWGHDELDVTPIHQFCISSRMGAILIGAYVGEVLAGFVYSFPAIFRGRYCQHSHLLAVLPEFQGRGIGKMLKWAQRREALERKIGLITWTFDPLQARNANLNLHTLGGDSRTFYDDFYGRIPTLCLGPGIPTDRLLIEWRIGGKRVSGKPGAPGALPEPHHSAVVLHRKNPDDPLSRPAAPDLRLKSAVVLAEVMKDVRSLAGRPDLIAEWQAGLRRTFRHYFAGGYRAEDFIFGERCFYVLRRTRLAR
ncbi:MAG TPA: GNAT family N-acetyltransferase [Candidatus Aminicenantes bacterium]|nr:GNAT family N-acetyltransferase [Candidatus Aminicenantes bacterium]